jgi:hypothetical protein
LEKTIAEAANIPGISHRRTQKAKRNASRYDVASEVILSWMALRIALPWYGSLANFPSASPSATMRFQAAFHRLGQGRRDTPMGGGHPSDKAASIEWLDGFGNPGLRHDDEDLGPIELVFR